jgi:hypothetical protein
MFDALERIDVNGEWSDENEPCTNCGKLIRTQPDSYAWTAQYVTFPDGDTLCSECVMADAESIIDEVYANDVRQAITWMNGEQLEPFGWRDAFPDAPSTANGFHPGQNDTPSDIIARYESKHEKMTFDYVFIIVDKGQFDIHYRMFVRDHDDNTED